MGVMFPGATFHARPDGGHRTGNHHSSHGTPTTTLSSIQDGLSNTILLGESTTSGYAAAGSGHLRRHRDELGLPAPELHLVHGVRQCLRRTSPGNAGTCYSQQPRTDRTRTGSQVDGATWDFANHPGTYENIGYGLSRSLKGRVPVHQQRPSRRLQRDHVRRFGPLPHESDQRHRLRQARHLRGQQAAPASGARARQLPQRQNQLPVSKTSSPEPIQTVQGRPGIHETRPGQAPRPTPAGFSFGWG